MQLNGTFAIGDYEENTAEFNLVKSIHVQADVDPEFALQERELFRFNRVIFGSDWPVCLLAGDYREVMEAALFALGEISSEEATRFMSGSAEEFYRLR